MKMVIFLVWFFTTALYAVPVFIGARRLMRHLKDNQDACEAFSRHVLIPLLASKAEPLKEAGGAKSCDAAFDWGKARA
jgi:hypothetical protein